jgi:hypothetical protein
MRAGEPALPPTCQAITWLGLATKNGESAATTRPAAALSDVFAGTGVRTMSPSDVVSGLTGEPNAVTADGAVQLASPFAGFGIEKTCAVAKEFPRIEFEPMMMWTLSWPSFG